MSFSINSIKAFCKTNVVKSILQTKPQNLKCINLPELKFAPLLEGDVLKLSTKPNKIIDNINPDICYHGSPYSFSKFDINKIGSGEGCSKRGRGIYLHRSKRYAPFFANIKSKDAPIHIGWGEKLDNAEPTIYEISGIKNLNLKKYDHIESKKITQTQSEFEKLNPNYDGIELPGGEICIFPKSIAKLNINKKQNLIDFIKENHGLDFRTWTTDTKKLAELGLTH